MNKFLSWAAASCLLYSCSSGGGSSAKDTAAATAATPATPATPPQSEFADARYTEMGKKSFALFASGDIKAWLDGFSDSAVYNWSSGDSLAGKAAITKYWTERRGKVIDSIQIVYQIWLPLKVNRPQAGPDMPGIWLLGWTKVNVKYKNGARLAFWTHTDQHFNSADKVDRYIIYIDRAPVNKALKVH